MGSLLVSTLAKLFLVYHEHEWLESCPNQFRSINYRIYVDIFPKFEHEDHVKKFLRYMNSHHCNI